MERRIRREAELPAIVLSTAAAIRPPAPPRYNQIVRRHRWPSILVFLTLFVGTVVATLIPTPVYRATALIDGNGGTPLPLTHTLAGRVVDRLDLGADALPAPAFDGARLLGLAALRVRRLLGLVPADDAGSLVTNETAADAVLAGAEIVPRGDSSLLEVRFTSSNPRLAAAVANALAEERVHAGDGTPAATRIQGQVDALRRELRTSQEALADTVRADFEAAKKQEALLAQAVQTQRAVVGDVGQRAVEAELLKGQVDATRARYERLLARVKETPGGAETRLVDTAAPPRVP